MSKKNPVGLELRSNCLLMTQGGGTKTVCCVNCYLEEKPPEGLEQVIVYACYPGPLLTLQIFIAGKRSVLIFFKSGIAGSLCGRPMLKVVLASVPPSRASLIHPVWRPGGGNLFKLHFGQWCLEGNV